MSTVLKIERQQTALSLIRIRLRLSYVAAITGLNDRFLRKVWKEVHGKSPSSGTSYTSIDTGLKTYSMARQSAAFANVYFATAAEEHAKIAIHAPTFLAAWMTYVGLGINEDLTPDLAWQVIRNITAKSTSLHGCKKCNTQYIVFQKFTGNLAKCPFCHDADKRARKNEPTHIHLVMERKSVGQPPDGISERRRPVKICADDSGLGFTSAYATRA
jgi:hypothetical protein